MMFKFRIQHHFASIEHPQSNGQAEAANKVIVDGLKKCMLEAKTAWVDQLPYVLWGYRTTAQTSTQETPYRLTYGCESMIPFEIVRVTAHCRDIATKQLIVARYNKKVRPRSFQLGDLVLKRADIRNKNAKDSKLAANWDGPYRLRETLEKGAYVLETLDESPIKRTWNADKLRTYYS
ncbi:hypothetical protein K1719_044834 [Acacia pycnantha]|nr:hypothetical protein K1719_044834 [Acacia pycnantha]